MARGNDEARLLEQLAEIRKLDERIGGLRVLAGAEVNIRPDGSLGIADDVLAKLDVVGVGLHTAFHLSREDFDIEAVLLAARCTGTAVEIDAQPDRLDLRDEHARLAVELGVKLVINSDAYNAHELRYDPQAACLDHSRDKRGSRTTTRALERSPSVAAGSRSDERMIVASISSDRRRIRLRCDRRRSEKYRSPNKFELG